MNRFNTNDVANMLRKLETPVLFAIADELLCADAEPKFRDADVPIAHWLHDEIAQELFEVRGCNFNELVAINNARIKAG